MNYMPQSEIRACYTIEKAAHLLCTTCTKLRKIAHPDGAIPTFKVLGAECITYGQLILIIENFNDFDSEEKE